MATKNMPVRVDDLDGTILYDDGRSVALSFDGQSVELDLSAQNYNALRDMLSPYLKKSGNGRRRTAPATPAAQAAPQRTTRRDLTAIREWATKNGYKVSARGRIPYSVMDAYARTHVAAG